MNFIYILVASFILMSMNSLRDMVEVEQVCAVEKACPKPLGDMEAIWLGGDLFRTKDGIFDITDPYELIDYKIIVEGECNEDE